MAIHAARTSARLILFASCFEFPLFEFCYFYDSFRLITYVFFLFFYLFGVLTRVSEGAQIIFRELLVERFLHQPRLFVRNVSEDFERERIISDFFILWNLS